MNFRFSILDFRLVRERTPNVQWRVLSGLNRKSRIPKSKIPTAFTLLETLVALTVFAIAVLGCVQALAEIGDTVSGLRMEGEARRALQNHVAELRAQRPFPSQLPPPAPKATNGLLLKDEVTAIEDADAGIKPEDQLFQVSSVASWRDAAGPQSLTNTFYLRGTK